MRRLRLIRVYKNTNAGGGVQSRLLEVLPRLAEHFDVRLLCYRSRGDRAEELEASGVAVDVVPTGTKWAPWNLARFVRYFRAHTPDLVHTHEYTANTLGVLAASRAGVEVLVRHIHTLVPWGWGGRLRVGLRRFEDVHAARRAQVTLAVSEAVREFYLAGTGLPPDACRVLYNGTDLSRFEGCREDGQAVRRHFGFPAGAPVVGTVGRLARGKGHREFLLAARKIAGRLPTARFLLVGDGGSRSELESLAAELGLGGRVVFAGYRTDVPACLGAMDLFLFPSRPEEGNRIQEGFGTAVVEAQAAGLPVVAFELPATRETLDDEKSGVIVAQGDVDGLATQALRYLEDRTLAGAASRAALRKAAEFSLDRCAESTLRLYEELLSKKRRST